MAFSKSVPSYALILLLSLGLSAISQVAEAEEAKKVDAEITTSEATTTTEDPSTICSKYTNTTCKECVSNSKCFFCHKNNVCAVYPYSKLMPVGVCGSLGDMAWGVCWVNFEVLIIVMSVLAFLLIVGICICCCCCCRKRRIGIFARDQAKYEQQRQELKMRSEQKKSERQSRTDEIRRKYGLMKDDNPYQRFEA